MDNNRLIGRILKLNIDNYRAFARLGFALNDTGLKPILFAINIKPFDQLVDREAKAHSISITKNLEKGDTFEEIAEDLTKESIVGNVVHYIKNNLQDIIANKQPDKVVKLNTDPYRKIK
jgi:hypothetical protein